MDHYDMKPEALFLPVFIRCNSLGREMGVVAGLSGSGGRLNLKSISAKIKSEIS